MIVSLSSIIVAGGALALCEVFLWLRRRKSAQYVEACLQGAKKETQDLAAALLSTPYPLIQLNEDRSIGFANVAALEEFPELEEEGQEHAILSGIEHVLYLAEQYQRPEKRSMPVGEKVYHQTIVPVQVAGHQKYMVYCYDLTHQKQIERQLLESKKEAEAASHAKGDFLANISHEIRTPMNGIIGLSDMLIEQDMPDEQKELVEAMNNSSRNLLVLLNDVLDFSKIEAGEVALEYMPFNLAMLAKQVANLQRAVADKKGVRLKVEIDKAVPEYVKGDPARLQQVLNNLVSNALKFTDKGEVRVGIKAEEIVSNGKVGIRIEVVDTGIGIPKDRQSAIFAKFTQADNSTSRKYGGTGLGLSISKDLVELMGGEIGLESEEGVGTTFRICIPFEVTDQSIVEETLSQPTNEYSINTKAFVLVVDDHPVNLLFYRRLLRDLGFVNFDEAMDGKHAFDLCQQRKYDFVLMDCQMPEMDGYEATRKIRINTENADTPIIAVTANVIRGTRDKCTNAGMNDYISKPIAKEQLLGLMQTYIPSALVSVKVEEEEEANTAKELVWVDWNHLRYMTGGDSAVTKEAVSIFLGQAEKDMHYLKQSLENDNHIEWNKIAHKLHGSALSLGAVKMADVCSRAENVEETESETKQALYSELLESYDRTAQTLKG